MRAQNWERPPPLEELLTLKLYLPTPNINQPTEITNPTQVLQGNGSSFSTPRGGRASAISSVADDRGGDNGDRNTHPDIPTTASSCSNTYYCTSHNSEVYIVL
jgi:hypothetical protein